VINYSSFFLLLLIIRYLAFNGKVKSAVFLYGLSIIYFYLEVTFDMGYFEHLQAANLVLIVFYSTLVLGPGPGFVALIITIGIFKYLVYASSTGLLFPLSLRYPKDELAGPTLEYMNISANLVYMYIFCVLVRYHIFSQLTNSLAREKEVSNKESIARKLADKAEAEKTRFLAAASHDLRQPVTSLVLNFEALLANHPEQSLEPAVVDMQYSISSVSKMLDNILTVSKLDANVVTPNIAMVSLDEILERSHAVNAASAGEKQLRVRVRETDLYCETDGEMLFRAFNNLVDNAVKYTSSGGLIIGVRKRHGKDCLYVIDSGIGIPSDSIDSIYEEFTMLVDSSRKSGSGLGLSIVRKICNLLNLKIRTVSRLGKGSAFYIELPKTYSIPSATKKRAKALPKADVVNPTVNLEPLAPPLKSMDLSGQFVAVVDDVETIRKTICRLLEAHKMRTVSATNWVDLQRRLANDVPSILITDHKLEDGVTGYDIIESVRSHFGMNIPSFIITGDTSPALVQAMSERGVDVYYKPLTTKALLGAVMEQLSKSGAHSQRTEGTPAP
jgi:signal transduction histidine kinase/CheY-like chemotaxis protein